MERISKIRGDSVTLAATIAFGTVRGIPPGFNALTIEAPSTTLEAITVGFGPRIKRVYFYDASVPSWREYSQEAVDRIAGANAVLINLSAMQLADRLYVGAVRRYRGLAVDVVGTNAAGTAALVGEYPLDLTWTDLSITDGTFSTRTLAQDGLITWTVPTTDGWVARKLTEVTDDRGALVPDTEPLYWTRFRPDAAITDTSVTVAELVALLNDALDAQTNNNEGQSQIRIASGNKPPYRINPDLDLYGGIELVSASITSAAILNWLAVHGG